MEKFIETRLANLSAILKKHEDAFISNFMLFSADWLFSASNAKKIISFLTDSQNHKEGVAEVTKGIMVDISLTKLRELGDVDIFLHKKYHEILMPTFNEGVFLFPHETGLKVVSPFDKEKDVGVYRSEGLSAPCIVKANSWKFIPRGTYHGVLFDAVPNRDDVFFKTENGKYVVNVCVKILAD